MYLFLYQYCHILHSFRYRFITDFNAITGSLGKTDIVSYYGRKVIQIIERAAGCCKQSTETDRVESLKGRSAEYGNICSSSSPTLPTGSNAFHAIPPFSPTFCSMQKTNETNKKQNKRRWTIWLRTTNKTNKTCFRGY